MVTQSIGTFADSWTVLWTILSMGTRAAWLINDSMSGEDIRLAVGAGLVHDTALRVRSGVVPAPANPLHAAIGTGMNVTVQPGQAVIGGSRAGAQGMYVVTEDAVRTITLDAGDPAQPRIDVIVARVRDTAYSDTAQLGEVTVVKGTPSATPATPPFTGTAALGTAIPLATVRVPAGASAGSGGLTGAGATLADLRAYASALGGTVLCPSVDAVLALTPLYEGLRAFAANVDRDYVHDGTRWRAQGGPLLMAEITGIGLAPTTAGPFTLNTGYTFADPFGAGVPYRTRVVMQVLNDGNGGATIEIVSPAFSATVVRGARAYKPSTSSLEVTDLMAAGGSKSYSGRVGGAWEGGIVTYADPATNIAQFWAEPA